MVAGRASRDGGAAAHAKPSATIEGVGGALERHGGGASRAPAEGTLRKILSENIAGFMPSHSVEPLGVCRCRADRSAPYTAARQTGSCRCSATWRREQGEAGRWSSMGLGWPVLSWRAFPPFFPSRLP